MKPTPMKASQSCSTCSALIPDADLESGAAIALLGKRYCASCKGLAAKEVSLDDLMEGAPVPKPADPTRQLDAPSPKPKAPARPAAKGAAKAAPPSRTPPPRTGSSSHNRRKAAARRSSKGPFIVLGAIVVVVAVLAVILVNVTSEDPKQPPTTGPTPPDPAPAPATETAEARAQREFVRVETLSRSSDTSLDSVLAEIEKIAAVCKGTPYEAKLEQLRNNTIKQKESVSAQKALAGLVDEIRKEAEADAEFRKYSALMEKLRKARETASKGASRELAELKKIQSDYSGRYERAAEPYFKEIRDAARVLAFQERRYDDALAQINRFPAHLRHSGAWNGLLRLKREIEDSKRRRPRR